MIERFDPLKGEMLAGPRRNGRGPRGPRPRLADEDLKKIYGLMVTTRTADIKAFKLQRQGRMGTYAPSRGHEACQVGSAFALAKDDWFFPYFRDLGMYLTLGYPLSHSTTTSGWGTRPACARPTASTSSRWPFPSPPRSPTPWAPAWPPTSESSGWPSCCTFGDGATSEGDFHEGMNFAGVFKTPNVFVCYDNQWAISVPRSRQTASATIAQKAVAYGFPGVLVDGNDVLAVYAAVREAVGKGEGRRRPDPHRGPHLQTRGPHDVRRRRRSTGRKRPWRSGRRRTRSNDSRPISRTEASGTRPSKRASGTSAADTVEKAVAEAEAAPPPSVEDLFAFTYGSMTPNLEEQLEEARAAKEGVR